MGILNQWQGIILLHHIQWFQGLFIIFTEHLDLPFWMVLLFIQDLPVSNDVLKHPVLVTVLKMLVHPLYDLIMGKDFFMILPLFHIVFVVSQCLFNGFLDWVVILV